MTLPDVATDLRDVAAGDTKTLSMMRDIAESIYLRAGSRRARRRIGPRSCCDNEEIDDNARWDTDAPMDCTAGIWMPSTSLAQPKFKEKSVGVWRVYENLGHLNDKRPKGIPNMAATPALDGRHAALGIEDYYAYSVEFRIGGPDVDVALKDIPDISPQRKVVFGRVDHDGAIKPIILTGGDENYFQADTEALARGSTFTIARRRMTRVRLASISVCAASRRR